jgi:hypothetical protein
MPLTAAVEAKPRKASMARRPFFTSFSFMSSDAMFRGSKGKLARKPVGRGGGREGGSAVTCYTALRACSVPAVCVHVCVCVCMHVRHGKPTQVLINGCS